jgi:hypothetical protein
VQNRVATPLMQPCQQQQSMHQSVQSAFLQFPSTTPRSLFTARTPASVHVVPLHLPARLPSIAHGIAPNVCVELLHQRVTYRITGLDTPHFDPLLTATASI